MKTKKRSLIMIIFVLPLFMANAESTFETVFVQNPIKVETFCDSLVPAPIPVPDIETLRQFIPRNRPSGFENNMPIMKSDPNIDYKLLIAPRQGKEYKILYKDWSNKKELRQWIRPDTSGAPEFKTIPKE